ncbi:Conserved_hypothetical protein [Hexamita inflata]|uniref:Partial n=1 Tax=Hexamita inflata TaxID=28002 RepID=A0ABP1ISJ9_9EUKA
MFIYSQATQSSDITLEMQQVSKFAVFGFNSLKQDIIDSAISVTINYSILTGALICMQCDIDIQTSQLQFVAHGIQISALILQSINIVQIQKVNISFRFNSNFSSGLINHVNQAITTFTVSQSIIIGFNNLSSASNGYICSKLFVNIHVELVSFQVCVENMQNFGSSSFTATLNGSETQSCFVCKVANEFVTYGLCQQQPQFSVLLSNQTVICELPFVFNVQMNTCECAFGFYLNVSYCVNVIQQFSMTQKNATLLENTLRTEINRAEIELKTAFIGLEQLIISNISDLAQNMSINDQLINQNIISTNQSVNNNINTLRTENTNQFNTMTAQIENKHSQITNQIESKFTSQTNLITDNQLQIKNNFTAQKDQIVDFRANITSTFNTIDGHINSSLNSITADLTNVNTTLKNKLDTQTTLITDNQLNIKNNFTAQKDQVADFRTNVTLTLNLVDHHITGISNELRVDLTNVNTTLKNKLDIQTILINDNQQYIKNNFTAQTNQIVDFRTNVSSAFNAVDSHITSFTNRIATDLTNVNTTLKNILDTQTLLINDNQQNLKNNFTAQANQMVDFRTNVTSAFNSIDGRITNSYNILTADLTNVNTTLKNKLDAQNTKLNDLKTGIDTRFSTVDSSISNAHFQLDDLKTQLTGTKTSIEAKISNVQTQISSATTQVTDNQNDLKTQITGVQSYIASNVESKVQSVYDLVGTVSTQTQLTSVYDRLLTAINAIAPTNPCIAWPGSVNQNGLCRCVYNTIEAQDPIFCSKQNSCCGYTFFNELADNFWQFKLKCSNGFQASFSGPKTQVISYQSSKCGIQKYYSND